MDNPVDLLGLANPSAETHVLAAMLHDGNAALQLAQTLEPDDFHDPRHGLVFEAIRHIVMGIEPVDEASVMATIRAIQRERSSAPHITPDYLATFQPADTKRAPAYAHSVKRMAWLRGAAGFAHWMIEELQTRPDPDELFTSAQERWQILQPQQAENRFVYGWDTVKMHDGMVRDRLRERDEGTLKRFDWPWASWNRDGKVRPLRPGMVGIIAAPDGQGKTTYLEMIAEHWAQRGMHTVYVHLEDQLDYKLDRRAARHALVLLDNIEDGNLSPVEQRQLYEAGQRIAAWADGLHYYDAAGENMTGIIRELETRVDEGVCDCVVFDYLDKVQPSRGQASVYGNNGYERQANDMEQLKTFAERCKVPVMTATQGNKTMQDQGKTQTRQAIQGSGQKSHKAQLVMILTRDIVGEGGLVDNKGTRIAEAGEYSPIVNVRIDKQNRGRTGGLRQFLAGGRFWVRDIDFERQSLGGTP